MNPDNFVNKENAPFVNGDTFIYEVEQRQDLHICPRCGCGDAHVKDHYWTETWFSETDYVKDLVRVRRVRFRCLRCGRTYSPGMRGFDRGCRISSLTRRMMVADMRKPLTFAQIADRYGVSRSYVAKLFDAEFGNVHRKPLPKVLCIDEIRFSEDPDNKFCCILYDFSTREIVDIIRSRQMAYLFEYFRNVPYDELNKVKYLISDMYDAYGSVRRVFMPQATHIVDLFHVVTQLTNAVNKLRVEAMKRLPEDDPRHRFMKSHWQQFLCRRKAIRDAFYTFKPTGECWHYDDIVFECVKTSDHLWTAYGCLQDLFAYRRDVPKERAMLFVENIGRRLASEDSEILRQVGRTYLKWRDQISNAFAENGEGIHYTNAVAECMNNHLKSIIKAAYGYRNFTRFRKRALLICNKDK